MPQVAVKHFFLDNPNWPPGGGGGGPTPAPISAAGHIHGLKLLEKSAKHIIWILAFLRGWI
jgi:hypothetical protein